MAQICNKEEQLSASAHEIYNRVDRPIATGSAHFMRAGGELHLLHADLELSDLAQAGLRVASARAAIGAAIDSYRESHQLAEELDFYRIHDERLASAGRGSAGVLGTLQDAQSRGLVELDDGRARWIDQVYRDGGDRAAFTGFIAELAEFAGTLAEFDPATADANPETWARFAWSALTAFDRIRTFGQSIAIINIFGMSRTPAAS